MGIASALDAQLADWPVVGSGPRARRALRSWVEHHPGVLAGFATPAELVASLNTLETRMRNEVLQALLVEAGHCPVAERTLMQATRGSIASVASNTSRSQWYFVWEDDELVSEVVLEMWRAIRRHAGARTTFTNEHGHEVPFTDPVKYLRYQVSRNVGTTARSRARSIRREEVHCRFPVLASSNDSSSDVLAHLLATAMRSETIDERDADLVWQYAVHDRSDAATAAVLTPELSVDAGRQRVQHRRKQIIGQLQLLALADAS